VAMLFCYSRTPPSGAPVDLVRSLRHKIKSSWGSGGEVDDLRANMVCGAVKSLGALVEIRSQEWTDQDIVVNDAFEKLLEHFESVSSYLNGDRFVNASTDRNIHALCNIMAASNNVFSSLLDDPKLNVFKAAIMDRKDHILGKLKEFSSPRRYPEASKNVDAIVRLQGSSIHCLSRFIAFLFRQTADRGKLHVLILSIFFM
jgi:hypothetical protein